ncbi:MAG: ATP-binding cassette domain-containing protein [Bacteroidota bacterium]
MIKIDGINKSFGALQVLKDFSLEVEQGEVVALVGPSGCGKSTLLNCITGLETQFEGNIYINGELQKQYLEHRRVGIVLQKYSNFEWMTTTENIETAFIRSEDISNQEETIQGLIRETGLTGFEDSYINELSGGMQQRVAVARALAQYTSILAFDEPFGALDVENRLLLQKLFRTQVKHKDLTALFITHDLEEAILVSDKIAVLNKIPSSVRKIFRTDAINFDNSKYSKEFIQLKEQIETQLNY